MLPALGPFTHLDVEKEMHPVAEQLFELGARRLADGLDAGAALAQHDRLLAVALDVDDLIDSGAPVFEWLPRFGFDRRRIRKFLLQLQI